MSGWLLLMDQAAEALSQLATGAVKSAADGPHGDAQNRPDLLITETVKFLEDDDGPVVGGQGVESVLDHLFTLGAFQRE